MPPKVKVQGLRKRYGALEAVAGIDFEIEDGEIFGLLGPNGAGKTTTIECVLGLRQPDAGFVEICGIDALAHPAEVRGRVGAALQSTSLHERITAREAIELFAAFYRRPVDATALLDRFSLGPKAHVAVDTLSGGQRQRLALALAFVNSPELVFLDEPTAGLDPRSRRELHDEIRRVRAEGHTVLLSTHLLEEAQQLCDRIAIINRGRIVAIGTPRDLIARSGRVQQIIVHTDRRVPAWVFTTLPGVVSGPEQVSEPHESGQGAPVARGLEAPGETGSDTATLRTTSPRQTLAALVDALTRENADIEELHVQKATLEDVFVDITGSAPEERSS
jgi:ABC-2 type transport system ATP-binding protein